MLLEREAVLGRLGHHLKGAVTGQGRVLLLHGAAGVGKTAITRRFAETARDQARVLIGACDPMSTPQPLGPLVDLAAAIDEDLGRSIVNIQPFRRDDV